VWGWAKRNVVSDAHPLRVPRKGRKVWTVAQLQTFLQRARSDRFFALWVLEATSGIRRCELAGVRHDLLDLDAGTLEIDVTRVVVLFASSRSSPGATVGGCGMTRAIRPSHYINCGTRVPMPGTIATWQKVCWPGQTRSRSPAPSDGQNRANPREKPGKPCCGTVPLISGATTGPRARWARHRG
jgi:hypothetical protein